MILICQNLRNNLQHPNEYIRGATLRFLCRIREEEILEPLVPSILANLEHRHSYVRRNAALAVAAVYRLPRGELLLADAPDTVERFLQTEQDVSAKRNAFLFLAAHAPDRAARYLFAHVEQLPVWGEPLQLAVLDLVRRAVRSTPQHKGRYIKVVLALLQASSTAVVYECAATLTALSAAPTAVRAAASCYCQLLVSVSDNNVKLIVLDRLGELREKHRDVVQDALLDILRALSTPSRDVRAKTLALALDLVGPRNVSDVVGVLKKEIGKAQGAAAQGHGDDRAPEYVQMLVEAVHACATRFPEVASSVVHLLMDFLGDAFSPAAALDVAVFVREICAANPALRPSIVERLREALPGVRAPRVAATALWVLGEYSLTAEEVAAALEVVHEGLGPLPLIAAAGGGVGEGAAAADPTSPAAGAAGAGGFGDDGEPTSPAAAAALNPGSKRPAVLADGTYATQAAVVEATSASAALAAERAAAVVPPLRALVLSGDYFVAGVVGATLAKLVLRLRRLQQAQGGGSEPLLSARSVNRAAALAMLAVTCMLRLGEPQLLAAAAGGGGASGGAGAAAAGGGGGGHYQNQHQANAAAAPPATAVVPGVGVVELIPPAPMDDDTKGRLAACLEMLARPAEDAAAVVLDECSSALGALSSDRQQREAREAQDASRHKVAQPDDLIDFQHLVSRRGLSAVEVEDALATDLARATGLAEAAAAEAKRTTRVLQLTGLSDPVYAEALVTVHQYDIVLDVTLVNRTSETLQAVQLELATMGDLKLVERLQPCNLAPGASKTLRANIKVSSTETGVIFGNVVYEGGGVAERGIVVLADVHLDIMDYIAPASVPDAAFRNMWAEFEWENRVGVQTTLSSPRAYLDHILSITNMRCLTPERALDGDCGYLAANLYARSVFGEDALANVSVERQADGKLVGNVRIRSKTQGIALSLGDKITLKQAKAEAPAGAAGAAAGGEVMAAA
jgi:coatomer subunit beta